MDPSRNENFPTNLMLGQRKGWVPGTSQKGKLSPERDFTVLETCQTSLQDETDQSPDNDGSIVGETTS